MYCDPSGHAFDIIWDIVGFCWSATDFYNDPSWENAGYIAWDIVGIALPVFPGYCVAKVAKVVTKYDEFLYSLGLLSKVKRVDTGIEFITSVKKGTDIVELAKSGKYLVSSYHDIKKYTHGYNHAVEAHHILEQRIFIDNPYGINVNDMLAVVIPGNLHKQFTKKWSEIIPKNSNYSEVLNDSTKLKEAINYVYEDCPELLQLAEEYINSLKLKG